MVAAESPSPASTPRFSASAISDLLAQRRGLLDLARRVDPRRVSPAAQAQEVPLEFATARVGAGESVTEIGKLDESKGDIGLVLDLEDQPVVEGETDRLNSACSGTLTFTQEFSDLTRSQQTGTETEGELSMIRAFEGVAFSLVGKPKDSAPRAKSKRHYEKENLPLELPQDHNVGKKCEEPCCVDAVLKVFICGSPFE